MDANLDSVVAGQGRPAVPMDRGVHKMELDREIKASEMRYEAHGDCEGIGEERVWGEGRGEREGSGWGRGGRGSIEAEVVAGGSMIEAVRREEDVVSWIAGLGLGRREEEGRIPDSEARRRDYSLATELAVCRIGTLVKLFFWVQQAVGRIERGRDWTGGRQG